MNKTNVRVTSREYKLILNADRLQDFDNGEAAFWHVIEFLVGKSGGAIVERQDEVKTRKTWYIDTPDFTLRRNGWVTRLRREKKKYKLTLKVRHPDRYVSAAQDLTGVHPVDGDVDTKAIETKFEEDILPPFTSKFAHSTSLRLKDEPKLRRMRHLVDIFPGLADLEIGNQTPLQTVNGFEAYETARWAGKARVEEGHTIKACLSCWYPTKERAGIPLIAEFSFDYDLFEDKDDRDAANPRKLEHFDVRTAAAAAQMFRSLQKQNGWARFHATTKTAFAYDAF